MIPDPLTVARARLALALITVAELLGAFAERAVRRVLTALALRVHTPPAEAKPAPVRRTFSGPIDDGVVLHFGEEQPDFSARIFCGVSVDKIEAWTDNPAELRADVDPCPTCLAALAQIEDAAADTARGWPVAPGVLESERTADGPACCYCGARPAPRELGGPIGGALCVQCYRSPASGGPSCEQIEAALVARQAAADRDDPRQLAREVAEALETEGWALAPAELRFAADNGPVYAAERLARVGHEREWDVLGQARPDLAARVEAIREPAPPEHRCGASACSHASHPWAPPEATAAPDACPSPVAVDGEATARAPKCGGPEECPRPCVECFGEHHFCDAYAGFAESEPEHPAAKAGCVVWYNCKHCDAWREDIGGDDEEGPVVEASPVEAPPVRWHLDRGHGIVCADSGAAMELAAWVELEEPRRCPACAAWLQAEEARS